MATAIRDGALLQTRGMRPDEPIHEVVQGFLADILPAGVQAITGLPYVDQVSAVDTIVTRLQGPLAPVVKELGLTRQVERLAALAVEYRAALDESTLSSDAIVYEEVREARELAPAAPALAHAPGPLHASSPGRTHAPGPLHAPGPGLDRQHSPLDREIGPIHTAEDLARSRGHGEPWRFDGQTRRSRATDRRTPRAPLASSAPLLLDGSQEPAQLGGIEAGRDQVRPAAARLHGEGLAQRCCRQTVFDSRGCALAPPSRTLPARQILRSMSMMW